MTRQQFFVRFGCTVDRGDGYALPFNAGDHATHGIWVHADDAGHAGQRVYTALESLVSRELSAKSPQSELADAIRAGWAEGSKLIAFTAGDNPRPVWERGSFASNGLRKLAAELDVLARRLEAAVADGARTDQAREEVRDVAVSLGDCSVALVVAARGIE